MESRFSFHIGGKIRRNEDQECRLHSGNTSWSGLPLETYHVLDSLPIAEFYCPKPHLMITTKGTARARWRASGCNHDSRWRPGTVVILDALYELQNVDIVGERDVILIELDPATRADAHEVGDSAGTLTPHVIVADSNIVALASIMENEISTGCRGGRIFAQSLSTALSSYVWSRYSSYTKNGSRASPALSQPRLKILEDYISSNLGEDISLSDLAKMADLSQQHLCRSFKAATGLSPHKYIMQSRIERAKSMIVEGSSSILAISFLLGFSSQSHFSTVFKQYTGLSPNAFRRYR